MAMREPSLAEAKAVAGPERKGYTTEEIERIRKAASKAQEEAERHHRGSERDQWHRGSGDPGCTERQFERMVLG